jgi:MoxR-like ATPase
MTETASQPFNLTDAANAISALRREVGNSVLGQSEVIDQVIVALLACGHVLIEGVPGLGKTLLVRALAKTFSGQFSRIQFTPDLMPSDITGHAIFDARSERFTVRKGPVFTHLLLADEINRAPAKTQAALLEVMQERQVTIEGEAFPSLDPFMVLATQNPVDQEGTYPLPEAQLDRFLMKILIEYPSQQDEEMLVRQITQQSGPDKLPLSCVSACITPEQINALQHFAHNVLCDQQVISYAVSLVRATRAHGGISVGASPRATIALISAAKAHALMSKRDFVIPDDVKQMVKPVLRHRIKLGIELEIDGMTPDRVLTAIVNEIASPRT